MLNPVLAAGNRISTFIPFDWLVNLVSLISTTIFALCFEYSGLHYIWRFYISNSPPARAIRRVWKISLDKWDTEALAERQKQRRKEIEKRRKLQEKILKEKREKIKGWASLG
jgi:hypothetical protein